MSIKVMKSSMVCPAQETPSGTLWLSKLDMMILQPYTHTHLFYAYHNPTCNTNRNTIIFDTDILKDSLSRVLVPFYPMAGRLYFNDENGRYAINCNAKGVLFVEAETTHALSDFGDYPRLDSDFPRLVFPRCDYSGGLSSFPLILAQVTRFKCGGVCLGLLYHHHVADGTSHLHFTTSWARIARGLEMSVYPVHDRITYVGPRNPPQVKFRHSEQYEPPELPRGISGNKDIATECIFKLTKAQINALKLQATYQGTVASHKQVSTFAVLAGHVWRSACKARELAGDEEARVYILVDARPRLRNPTLAKGYCGNVILYSTCVAKAGEIMCKPLWYVASKIQHAVEKMNNNSDYLRSAIDYVESHPNFVSLVRGAHFIKSPNLVINSWNTLPFKELDFGWGRPKYTGISGIKYEGQAYLIPSINEEDSVYVPIKLQPPHMALFEKFFYSINNSYSALI